MKISHFVLLVAVLMSVQSEAVAKSNKAKHKPTIEELESMSGVVADDPSEVRKVPILMSADAKTKGHFKKTELAGATSTITRKGNKTDRTAPTLSILSPANGQSVTGIVAIKASASDNVGVASVKVSVDGVSRSTLTVAPYQYNWDTQGVVSGTHSIVVTASDAAGNVATQSVSVSLNSAALDVTPPQVAITSPKNGDTIASAITVQVSASDNVRVNSVALLVDSLQVALSSASPYQFSLNPASLTDGMHTLSAKAVDGAGNSTTTSISIAINTSVVVLPPTSVPTQHRIAMPPVANQGSEGSCVAFGSAYYALSGELYYKTNAGSYSASTNIISPEYLFDQTKTSSDCSGSAVTTALNFMKNSGSVRWQTVPYSSTNGCSLVPTSTQQQEASNNRIVSYSALYAYDTQGIKALLAGNHPLITPANIDANFYNAGPGYVWNTKGETYNLHVITLVGYDDSKNAYLAVNSWGTGWGDQGYIWIDYALLQNVTYQVFTISR